LIVALALSGCGGDDDSSSARVPTTDVPAGATTDAPAGATGPGSSKAKKDGAGRKGGRGAQEPSRETSAGSGGTAGSGGSGGGTNSSGGYVPPQNAPGGGRTALQQDLYRQGRVVCRAFPLNVLAQENRAQSRKPAVVAKAYSENYILGPRPRDRRAVYEGCLKGIESRLNK
jgi:hypothetical protein